jgi:hypothetical protein
MNNNPRYLTKSRFKLAVECPTKLYYAGKTQEYRDNMAENEFLAMLAEGGYQVGALAKCRYPDGIEITERSHAAAERRTQELLNCAKVVLFEPAIRVGDFFIRIDILIKSGSRFELIEVKAKSYNSREPKLENARGNIDSGMLPYIQDAAFQTWVLRQAYPDMEISTWLMMPDKAHSVAIDGINQMFKIKTGNEVEVCAPPDVDLKAVADTLLAKVDVNKYVWQVLQTPIAFPGGRQPLAEIAPIWAAAYRNDQRVQPVIGAHCGACQFRAQSSDTLKSGIHECWKLANAWNDKDFEGGTVLDLWNFRRKQTLIEQGVLKLSQVEREHLGDFDDEPAVSGLSRPQRQWLQINGIPHDYDHGGFYFDAPLMAHEMGKWTFPYHFIDFETSSVALPFHKHMQPYQAVAFQFSHHIMDFEGNVRHAGEFLEVEPGCFPNFAFVRALKQQLGNDDGTVFMWSHHENSILSSILRQLHELPDAEPDRDELSEFIRSLIKDGERAMVDLCKLAEKAFFHPDTKGSNSIKKVLPAVLKASKPLLDRYMAPVYGHPTGIPSLNFASAQGFTWIEALADGSLTDPYARLKQYATDLLPPGADESASIIAEGGAAATAYSRLQFEDLTEDVRQRIKDALLRYCELDTLAMVMVVEAWQHLLAQ